MSPETISLIGTVVTNTGIVVVAYLTYRTRVQSKDTHDAVNSRLDAFIKASQGKFHAEGVLQEKADEQKRKDEARGQSPGLISGSPPPTVSG